MKLHLVLNKQSITDTSWDLVKAAAQQVDVGLIDSAEKSPYTDDEDVGPVKEPRSRAAHMANWHMRELEQAVLRDILPDRPAGSWVAIDGALGREFRQAKAPEGFVGVVKNFGKDLDVRGCRPTRGKASRRPAQSAGPPGGCAPDSRLWPCGRPNRVLVRALTRAKGVGISADGGREGGGPPRRWRAARWRAGGPSLSLSSRRTYRGTPRSRPALARTLVSNPCRRAGH